MKVLKGELEMAELKKSVVAKVAEVVKKEAPKAEV